MFSLSISASVIFATPAPGAATGMNAGMIDATTHRPDSSLVTLSVVPSRSRRWAIDLLGATTLESGPDTYDIQVGWADGAYAELLCVPLTPQDTLVVDESRNLDVYDVSEQTLLPVSSTSPSRRRDKKIV